MITKSSNITKLGLRKALTIKTVIKKYLKENKKLCLCFVDFRKAYNNICREALRYKLSAYYDVSIKFINIVHNMYNKVHLSVRFYQMA